jgi:hypothetical protein
MDRVGVLATAPRTGINNASDPVSHLRPGRSGNHSPSLNILLKDTDIRIRGNLRILALPTDQRK